MSDAAEKAIKGLEALDKLFCDLWDFATEKHDSVRDGTANGPSALTAIKHSIGSRPDGIEKAAALIREQAARIEALEAALKPFAEEAEVYARNAALEQYPDTYLACVPLGDLRKAAALVKP